LRVWRHGYCRTLWFNVLSNTEPVTIACRQPSIVPNSGDQNVYLVVDDLGRAGRVWREAVVDDTDLEAVIVDLLDGQYKNPLRVVSFNTAEQWSQDVFGDVAHELRHRCDLQQRDVPFFVVGTAHSANSCQF
jgi:hypothetical protein